MEKRLVLIVEDEESISSLYSSLLEQAGIEAVIAVTGKDGMEQALYRKPDLILMDIQLPDMTGHEAVEKIRLDSWGKDAKIIYLTNLSDAENISEAVANQSEEYIIKAHIDNQELLNRIRSAIV